MGHVFMSYAHTDIGVIDRLADALKQSDLEVWLDREGISGGAEWRTQIVYAIKSADVFLVALSPDSVKSRNVRKELAVAENWKIPILPLVVRQSTIPEDMEYTLAELQRVDISDDFVAGLARLLRALSELRRVRPTSLPSTEELERKRGELQESDANTKRQNTTLADPRLPTIESMQKFIEEFAKSEARQAQAAQEQERVDREIQARASERKEILATAQAMMAHADKLRGAAEEMRRRVT
jgi:hypothetical protein